MIERIVVPPTATRQDYLPQIHQARKLSRHFLCRIDTRLWRCCSYPPSGKLAFQQAKGPRSTRQFAASDACRIPFRSQPLDHLIFSGSTSNSAAISDPFSHTCQIWCAANFFSLRLDIRLSKRQRTPDAEAASHSLMKREMQLAAGQSRRCKLRSQQVRRIFSISFDFSRADEVIDRQDVCVEIDFSRVFHRCGRLLLNDRSSSILYKY